MGQRGSRILLQAVIEDLSAVMDGRASLVFLLPLAPELRMRLYSFRWEMLRTEIYAQRITKVLENLGYGAYLDTHQHLEYLLSGYNELVKFSFIPYTQRYGNHWREENTFDTILDAVRRCPAQDFHQLSAILESICHYPHNLPILPSEYFLRERLLVVERERKNNYQLF